ncbi:10473_t:CDS:1, partial [Scutellospora calospora]
MYEIAQIRVNSEITPIKTINNIRRTCKDFNNIFTILFKKSFIDYFDIKINLDSTRLWKELIENSIKKDIMNEINEYCLQLRMEHSEYSYLKSTTQINDISISEFFTFLGCYMKYNQLRSIVLIPTYDYITREVFYDYNCIECDEFKSFRSNNILKCSACKDNVQCYCGDLAIKKIVKKQNQNQGKYFYTCKDRDCG